MREIRFDDVEALRAEVSAAWTAFGRRFTVSQELIDRFADFTNDRSWIHTDVMRARKESPYGGTIAHGLLTLALLPQISGGDADRGFAITGHRNIVNYGSDRLRFTGPVPAGRDIHMRSRLARVEARPKGTAVTIEMAIHVVGSETPALVYEMILLYQ